MLRKLKKSDHSREQVTSYIGSTEQPPDSHSCGLYCMLFVLIKLRTHFFSRTSIKRLKRFLEHPSDVGAPYEGMHSCLWHTLRNVLKNSCRMNRVVNRFIEACALEHQCGGLNAKTLQTALSGCTGLTTRRVVFWANNAVRKTPQWRRAVRNRLSEDLFEFDASLVRNPTATLVIASSWTGTMLHYTVGELEKVHNHWRVNTVYNPAGEQQLGDPLSRHSVHTLLFCIAKI